MSGHRPTEGQRRRCECARPIPYRDPGEPAACAKCGHELALGAGASAALADAEGYEPTAPLLRAPAEPPGALAPEALEGYPGPEPARPSAAGRAERVEWPFGPMAAAARFLRKCGDDR